MKLSEMNTEQFFDVLIAMSPHVWNFMDDENVQEFVAGRKEKLKSGIAAKKVGKKLVFDIAVLAIKERRDDTLGILSVLHGISADKMKKQNPGKTLVQVIEVIMMVYHFS